MNDVKSKSVITKTNTELDRTNTPAQYLDNNINQYLASIATTNRRTESYHLKRLEDSLISTLPVSDYEIAARRFERTNDFWKCQECDYFIEPAFGDVPMQGELELQSANDPYTTHHAGENE